VKPLSEEEIADGWIEHDGVKCPVGPYRHVDIMWSDRLVRKNHEAGYHQWRQFKDETASISAYRIVDQGEALKAAVHEGVDKMGDSEWIKWPYRGDKDINSDTIIEVKCGDGSTGIETLGEIINEWSNITHWRIADGEIVDKAVPDALDQGASLDDLEKSRTSFESQCEKTRGILNEAVALNDEPRWSHEEIIEHQRMLASRAMGDDKPAKDHRVMEFYKVQTETMTQVYLGDDRVCTLKGNVVTMAKHCPVMTVGDVNRLANFLRKMIK